ncbi:hypothetical protein BY458DRAFT_509868 [Sporodiniella umbellata]|nr:hypothetical protein BY458DRAFT_509868 [Sporodiniella umbellata]
MEIETSAQVNTYSQNIPTLFSKFPTDNSASTSPFPIPTFGTPTANKDQHQPIVSFGTPYSPENMNKSPFFGFSQPSPFDSSPAPGFNTPENKAFHYNFGQFNPPESQNKLPPFSFGHSNTHENKTHGFNFSSSTAVDQNKGNVFDFKPSNHSCSSFGMTTMNSSGFDSSAEQPKTFKTSFGSFAQTETTPELATRVSSRVNKGQPPHRFSM